MQKFFTEISWYWLVLIAVIAALLSFWLYFKDAKIEHLKKWVRGSLGVLRFLSFFLIGVLLIGILFERTNNITEKPLLIFNVDHSASMLNYHDSSEVRKLQSKIDDLTSRFNKDFDIVKFPLEWNGQFEESQTDLSKPIAFINENYVNRNLGAIVTFSDGNYNEGADPLFEAEKVMFVPFYTIGVGDTIQKKDQVLESVKSNKIAFLGNEFPIEYYCSQFGFDQKSSQLKVYVDGVLSKTEKVDYQNQAGIESSFNLTAKKIGIIHLRIELSMLDGEYTVENNVKDIYIEVLDSRNKIVMISASPNPDIGAFHQVFKENSRIEFSDFSVAEFKKEQKADLFILHNVGKSSKGKELMTWLEQKNKNYIYLSGVEAPVSTINQVKNGVAMRKLNGVEDYLAVVNSDFNDFVINDDFKTYVANLPPLRGDNSSVQLSNSASVILNQRVGNLQKKDPLVVLSKQLNSKQVLFLGEGLWKWRMFDYRKNKSFEHFDFFINKIVQYLMVKENKSKLQVMIDDDLSSINSIKVNAEFYNDAYELITDPNISFEIINEVNEETSFEFLRSGLGYFLNLGKLKGGKYQWRASSDFNDKHYEQNGSFVVVDKNKEQLATKSDFRLLNDIAEKTKGQFLEFKNMEQVVQLIESDDNITSTAHEERSYADLLDYFWIVFIILGLLSIEWFIRKYSGTY